MEVKFHNENSLVSGRLSGYIEWLKTQSDSTDVYENKRYAVVLKENNMLIGMVGMGIEENLNEVEMAYCNFAFELIANEKEEKEYRFGV